MIKLFESTAKSFLDNGLGVIHPIKCIEHKKKSLNGWYVECEFPIDLKDRIKQDVILYVNTKEKGGQPFRCSNPKYKDKKIIVTANHVVFDSRNYILEDVRPENLSPVSFLKWINERTDTLSPFLVSSDVSGSGTKYFIRKTLLNGFTEAEALFGGSFDVDGFSLALKAQVGNDDGFSIAYGKNLQSFSVIEDWSNVCTKLLPVGPDGITLPEVYLYSNVSYDKPYTKVVEFNLQTTYLDDSGNTVSYTSEELTEILRAEATAYVEKNKAPRINYLLKSDVPQELRIGDIVHVKHPVITIDTEVQAYSYNVISKRVLTIEFGNYDRNVKHVIDSLKKDVEEAKTSASGALLIANQQTDLINNLNKNGLVYIDDNEILVLDKLPKEDAVQVWRLGLGGLGFSNNGYLGPYKYAFTQDGKLNADFIQANSITSGLVNLEGLSTKNGNFVIHEDGSIEAINGKFSGNIDGSSFSTVKTQQYQYTQDDMDVLYELYFSEDPLTDAQLAKYDLNQNGIIENNDALIIQNILNGKYGDTNGMVIIDDIIQMNKDNNGMIVLERRINGTTLTRTEYNSGSINKIGGSILIDGEEVVTALGGTTARFG